MASTEVSSSTTSSSSKNFDSWFESTKSKVMDLKLSDSELIKFLSKELSADSSPEKRNAIQQLVNLRSEVAGGLSNILRVLSETTRNIINNLR